MKNIDTYNCLINKIVEIPEKQIQFLKEIEEISKKYDLSISHEDFDGNFIIEKFTQKNIEWLKDAYINYL